MIYLSPLTCVGVYTQAHHHYQSLLYSFPHLDLFEFMLERLTHLKLALSPLVSQGFHQKTQWSPCQVERRLKKKKSMCSQILLWLIQFLALPNKNWEEEKGIKLTYDCVWEQGKKNQLIKRLASGMIIQWFQVEIRKRISWHLVIAFSNDTVVEFVFVPMEQKW